MRNIARVGVLVAVSILLGASAARAQGYVAPSLGVTFGNPSALGRANYGVDLGFVSTEAPLGLELDVMYAPSFFGNVGPYGNNSVSTVTANIMLVPGEGGRRGRRRGESSVRPFVSLGAGIMHEKITLPPEGNTDLAVDFGVGIMAITRRSVGVRGDLRYFRDLIDNQEGNRTNIDFGAFHFWRASLGLVLSF
jgi:hypothetical protein